MKHANAALRFREELKKKNIPIASAQDILTREASIPSDVVKSLTSGEMEWKDEFYQLVNKTFGINVKATSDNPDDDNSDDAAASSEAAPVDNSSNMGSDDSQVEDKPMEEEEEEEKLVDLVVKFKADSGIEDDQVPPEWLEAFINWMETRKSGSHITVKNSHITVKDAGMTPIAPPPETSVAVKPATAIDTEINPYKQQAEQTNVLLGLVVNLLQTISSQLESSNTQPKQGLELPPVPQQVEAVPPPSAEMNKSIVVINRYVENLSQRLNALNL